MRPKTEYLKTKGNLVVKGPMELRKYPGSFKENEVAYKRVGEPTGRECTICGKEIYTIYNVEVDIKTGDLITCVCIRDNKYTCSIPCHKKWLQPEQTGFEDGCFVGNRRRDKETGELTINKVHIPHEREFTVDGEPIKWGSALLFGSQEEDKLDPETKALLDVLSEKDEIGKLTEKMDERKFSLAIED